MVHSVTDMADAMSDAELPVMAVVKDGERINCMYGYTTAMSAATMRSGLVPVSTDRKVEISYLPYGRTIRTVSYEITAPDTGEVIENAIIGNFTEEGGWYASSFTISSPIRLGREYPICFTIDTGNATYHYYTTLLQSADISAGDYLSFVKMFYTKALIGEDASGLGVYMETDTTKTSKSLANVDITSTMNVVMWGSLEPTLLVEPVPVVREINSNTCCITQEYYVTAKEGDETRTYRVEEFYRMRMGTTRIRLLDFERTVDRVYSGAAGSIISAGINLGIAGSGLEYKANDEVTVTAFVCCGELWSYSEHSAKLTRVFSFREEDPTDLRGLSDGHTIRILRVGSGGDVDFVVSGYMPRGPHEGRVGVSVCHFDAEKGSVEERAFIEASKSEEYLEADLEKLCYSSADGDSYIYIDGCVMKISSSGKSSQLLNGVHPDCFYSSDSGSLIAYMPEMDPDASKTVTVHSLEGGSDLEIDGGNSCLRLIGFIGEDVLYGEAKERDIEELPAGGKVFAMNTLYIEDYEGNVIKRYSPSGEYVESAEISDGRVSIQKIKRVNGEYVSAGTDSIVSNAASPDKEVTVVRTSSDVEGMSTVLQLPSATRSLSPSVENARIKAVEEADAIGEPKDSTPCPLYYVYGGRGFSGYMTDPAKAVEAGDEEVGTVLCGDGQYLYQRGAADTEGEIDNGDIPKALLSGEIDVEKLKEQLGEGSLAVNLTGCTLSEALYQVSQGRAVAALKNDGTVTLIVGYNAYNTIQYDFEDGSHFYFGINDSTADFAGAGNVFVTVVEPQATVKEG